MPIPDPKELPSNQDLQDWIEALENLNLFDGSEYTKKIVNDFFKYAENKGFIDDFFKQIPFENSIFPDEEEDYPGDWEIEEKIRHYVRWNAIVMVLKPIKIKILEGIFQPILLLQLYMKLVLIISFAEVIMVLQT